MHLVQKADMINAFAKMESTATVSQELSRHIYEEARTALERIPIPTRRTEAWKYTPVNKIINHSWLPAEREEVVELNSQNLPDLEAHRIVIVNGFFRDELSKVDDDALVVLPLSVAKIEEPEAFDRIYGRQADHQVDLFVAINTAFHNGGVFIRVRAGKEALKPVHIINVNSQKNTAMISRNIILSEKSSRAHVIYSNVNGDETVHSNVVSEILIEDNASLTLDKLQSGGNQSFHYSSEEVYQGRDSSYTENTMTFSGAWTRNDPHIRLQGRNSICHLNGAYLPDGNELVDNHSVIDHRVPHCESHELYKGVIYESGKGVFNGKVFVRKDAQKTNAFQQNANIVMSNRASMNSKPELEIYADDVKCSHGSTTGQLDREALFYLQSRGLSKDKARQLLVNAFAGEVVERLLPELQEFVWSKMEAKLN